MRKIISLVLVLIMILSLFSFSVSAEHWAQDAQAELVEKPKTAANYKFLRLKLTPEKPMIEFTFTRDVSDCEFFSGYQYNFQ